MNEFSIDAHQRRRWLRPNAHHYIRHDAWRFVPPGSPLHVGRDVVKYFWPEREANEAPRYLDRAAPPATEAGELLRIKQELAALRAEIKLRKLLRAFKAYDPNQPRVAAGNPDGGQWTTIGGSAGVRLAALNHGNVLTDAGPTPVAEPAVRLVQDGQPGGYSIDLSDEEGRGSHTIDKHVNKSPASLIAQAREAFSDNPNARDSRSGSFPSMEAATKLVNSTLAQNRIIVDQVASGVRRAALVSAQFEAATGYEAVIPNRQSQPHIRETYGVGVVIYHDRASRRGFSVLTAFPTNR